MIRSGSRALSCADLQHLHHSRPTDTGMLTRFTGTPENKAALVTTVPMARLGLSEELANAIVF